MSPLGFKIPLLSDEAQASSASGLPVPLDDAVEVFYNASTFYASGTWTGVNGGQITQGTAGARPTLDGTTNRLLFDGGDRLSADDGTAFVEAISDVADLTFAIIFTVSNQDASQGLFEAYRSAADPTLEYVFLRAIDAGLDGYLTAFEKRTAQIFARYDSGTASDTVYLAVVRCKRAGKLTLNRNDTAEVESAGTNANQDHGAWARFYLGYSGDGTGTGTYLIGTIGAFAAWTRELSDAEVSTLRVAMSDDVVFGTEGVNL